jgi:hypothetical protein
MVLVRESRQKHELSGLAIPTAFFNTKSSDIEWNRNKGYHQAYCPSRTLAHTHTLVF